MSHIPDMHTYESGVIGVGWLHPDHPFSQADPSPDLLAKLKEFHKRIAASVAALQLPAAGGFHTCEFCGQAHGTRNFGVPAGDQLFYCPELILHYVEEHRYAPPADFVAALLASPLPGTREYVDAVAPYLQRQRAASIKDIVSVPLERHVALVMFDFLSRFGDTPEFWGEERPEKVAIWTLLSNLESILFEPFDPQYQDLLNQARRLTQNYGEEHDPTSDWPVPFWTGRPFAIEQKDLILAYEAGPRELRKAVAGLNTAQVLSRPIPGKWSIQEVICHLADFELINAERIKRVLAEEAPTFFSAGPEPFAAHMAYAVRDVEEELDFISRIRRHVGVILRELRPEQWQRVGTHSTDGPLTVEQLVTRTTRHIPHHVRFIAEKRAALE